MQEFRPEDHFIEKEISDGMDRMRREFYIDDESMEERMADDRETYLANGWRLTGKLKVGRNQACPCKSGKKFKNCCIRKCK